LAYFVTNYESAPPYESTNLRIEDVTNYARPTERRESAPPYARLTAGQESTNLRTGLVITASESLKKRPVSELIDALRSLGANIEYTESDGKLPVKIFPSKLTGNSVSISGEISSQFISAMMLIGPYISGGLKIEMTGEILSLPYILMTKSVMEYFGAVVDFNENIIFVHEGTYVAKEITIEPDWSAASYWYEIAALSDSSEIVLHGLKPTSLQGDSAIVKMMEKLGVHTEFNSEGALLTKKNNFKVPEYFSDDFSGCPDLGPAVANTCAGLNITADLLGLKNFRLKESDRAAALQRELYNMNVKTDFCGGSKFKVYSGTGIRKYSMPVKTYHDHRIAMAFAPLALKAATVFIEDPEVVKKSYPHFFEDLVRVGFLIL
ncbi:MAG TPA: 3-phosphoshikimate 1-carboxyvinyltransferase, partial [Bacteroidia bacterium]|nr:3-phosphoshikimate 1-carboxyvinyltransferase [Bacteroidia bacterium]